MSKKQISFLCVGSASQDVYLRNVDDLVPVCASPEDCFYNIHLGDKIYVNKVDFMCGGGASNASVTFARGGEKSYFMGLLGCDPAATACLASMSKEGVDTKYVSYTKRYNTDYSTLLLAPNGERSILTYRGCGMHIKPDNFDLSKVTDEIDWIYMTSMVGHFDILKQIATSAQERGIKIAWNPGGAELAKPNELKKILPYITILSVNKEEAQRIVKGDTLPELLYALHEYCPVCIITDGRNGAMAMSGDDVVAAGLYDAKAKPVDRTGAGDAFCSGFTLKYAQGESIKDCVHFASANSASVVEKMGSKPGILRRGAEANLEPMDIREVKL